MKVGDIVEFRCSDVFMEEKFKIRGIGLVIGYDKYTPVIAFEVQWASGEVSWEHKNYLELL